MTAEDAWPTPQLATRHDPGAAAGPRRVNGVREAFHGLCIAAGLQVIEAMMEADREVLCGPKGRHQVERPAWRGGSVDSQVTLGGRQVELPRLRVRSTEGEVPLASLQWAAATDPLDEHTSWRSLIVVDTRIWMGVALLRRRPRELRRASRQELLDASKAWWGGWRGRLADRRRRPFSVSLGVIPLVFARFVEVPVRVEVAAGP